MLRVTFSALTLILTSALAPQPAAAAPSPLAAPPQCFLNRDYQGFHAVDDHSFYIRVRFHDIYRIETVGVCPMLDEPDARLITVEEGTDQVCGPLDWRLSVATVSSPPVPCIVKSQTPLTPAQAAAIPKGQRP